MIRQIFVLVVGVIALSMMAQEVHAMCIIPFNIVPCEQITPTCITKLYCKDSALCGQYTSQANYYGTLAQRCYANSNYMQVVYDSQWKAYKNLATRYCSSCHKEQICQRKTVSAINKCPAGYQVTTFYRIYDVLSTVASANSIVKVFQSPGTIYTIEETFKIFS